MAECRSGYSALTAAPELAAPFCLAVAAQGKPPSFEIGGSEYRGLRNCAGLAQGHEEGVSAVRGKEGGN